MNTRDLVFQFIIRYKTTHQGNTPTLNEIARGCGLGDDRHAKYHVDKLVDTGRITRTGRNIELPGAVWEMRSERGKSDV